MVRFFLVSASLALLAACGPAATLPEPPPSAAASGACADGGPRLEATGLCQAEADALIGADPNVRTPELEGCTWSVKEVAVADEVILYRAAACNGVDTRLDFAGGARRAELSYASSAVYGESGTGRVVVALYGVDPDPQGALKAAIAEAPAADRGACQIVAAEREGWPADALILAPSAAEQEKRFKGRPVVACGPLGVDETKVSYWRVRQGFAWFFDLGDRESDIDAGNMLVVTRGADGTWRPKA